MAFTPYAGSAGNFKLVNIAAALSTPMPSLTGSTASIAGIRSWALKPNVNSKSLTHFQSTASTQGCGYWSRGMLWVKGG